MEKKNTAFSEAQMLIRKPVAEVFEAFIEPEITKNFWFTKGSGRLEVNQVVTWEWEMYHFSTKAIAREILPSEKLVFEWGEPLRIVEMTFKTLRDGSTYVTAKESGYDKTGDELLAIIRDSTGGFTTVLDGLKAFLEHGIRLNLIADKFPNEVSAH